MSETSQTPDEDLEDMMARLAEQERNENPLSPEDQAKLDAMFAQLDDPPPYDPIAESMRIAETEGPEAADAMLRRWRDAREAQAHQAAAVDGAGVGPPADNGKSAAEVGEHLGDPTAEDDPIDVAKRETAEPAVKHDDDTETVDRGPSPGVDLEDEAHRNKMNLREQIRAAIAKYNGGVEFGEDPLEKEKKKVAKALNKVGRTLADLPSDWDTLPKIAKVPGERSRQNELFRVFEEGEKQMRDAERLHELERRGRPPNYDLLPRAEKIRIDANIRKRRERDKKRKPPSTSAAALLPVANVGGADLRNKLHEMLRTLNIWANSSTNPRARQLRKREHQLALVKAAAAYARYFHQHDGPPSHAELARWLRRSEDQARRKLDLLKALYLPGGPWASA